MSQFLYLFTYSSLEVLGCVVANELDSKRANMLAFQTLKMTQNYAMIINQDVTTLPDNIKFDRVLCDVPCSGDGTVRKNDSKSFTLFLTHL